MVMSLCLPCLVCQPHGLNCFHLENHGNSKDGDVLLTAFFPIYLYTIKMDTYHPGGQPTLTRIQFKNFQHLLALVFAVEEINRNPHLLPNITLGFDFYNIMHSNRKTLENPLRWLTGLDRGIPNYTCKRGGKAVAVISETSISAQMGTLLELYRIPQLTLGPLDPLLSDSSQFPSVYQMAPKDTSLALAMVSLMLHFGWTWVGLAIPDLQKGDAFLSDLSSEMQEHGLCLAFVELIPVNSIVPSEDLEQPARILTSSANVVVLFGDTEALIKLIFLLMRSLLTWKVWVTTSRLEFATNQQHFLLHSLHGALIFSNHRSEIPGFQHFLQTATPAKYPENVYLALFWSLAFHCPISNADCRTLQGCPPNASLDWLPWEEFDMTMSDGSYHIYNTVHAIAHSLHKMHQRDSEVQPRRPGGKTVTSRWQLHYFLKSLQFTNPAGDPVNLDQKRKPAAAYDIFNFWNFPEGLGHKVKVGHFSPYNPPGQQLSVSEELIEWATGITQTPHSVCSASCGPGFRKTAREGEPVCCFDCIPCPDNKIANETDTEECVTCPDHQYANAEHNQCLDKKVTFLAFKDPLGMVLVCTALSLSVVTAAILAVFVKHQGTPIVKANNRTLSYMLLISLLLCFLCSFLFIGRPNTATCLLRQITFALVFTLAVSAVLAKTITVVLAFKAMKPGRTMRRLLVSGAPNAVIPICVLIQLTLCGIWLATSPPFVDTDAHSEHGHIILLCNEGSITAFYCVLGFLGSLALGTFTVAFLARKLPDTFNEAKFLTFSMLVFCSVWVTFLPVYQSTKGKVMVAVEVFSILASGVGLLSCIFVPKCYIILLKPERNSLQVLKATRDSQRNRPTVMLSSNPLSP
ncbi:vomeronasal type-2 receptor 116-like [Ochotona princeps]|uniref:vomeronasal type-2 receptor 116-like n=1 Tax=Ochotona princeps TaxID=9978 RepID=UPI00271478F1|nr:vomeronasal type-2 receptor 116-like [Ochotona princeps]